MPRERLDKRIGGVRCELPGKQLAPVPEPCRGVRDAPPPGARRRRQRERVGGVGERIADRLYEKIGLAALAGRAVAVERRTQGSHEVWGDVGGGVGAWPALLPGRPVYVG